MAQQGPPFTYETDSGTITSDRQLTPGELAIYTKVGQREYAKQPPPAAEAPSASAEPSPNELIAQSLAQTGMGTQTQLTPGTAGDAGAIAASIAANLLTRGKAGPLMGLVRATAPAAGGAAAESVVSGEAPSLMNALIRGATGGLGEVIGGGVSAGKRLAGLPASKDTAATAARLAKTGNRITEKARPMTGDVGDLVRAGEGSPRIGDKGASSSLTAALENRQKDLYAKAVKTVGSKTNVDLPDGRRVSFADALDEYKGAVAGKVDADGNRIDGERIWGSIQNALTSSNDPRLQLVAIDLNEGRTLHAKGMSFARLIDSMKTEGLVDSKGNIDMQKLQGKFHKITDEGLVDPAVRTSMERATKRGYSGPMTDEPGKTNIGTWIRWGGNNVGGGFHPKLPQLPRQVGTGPKGLAPETSPFEGKLRELLSIASVLSGVPVTGDE